MAYESERRRHLRAEIDWPISITQDDLCADGVTKDIGHNGALICCEHKLSPGESVRIAFRLPDRLPLIVDAEVTRSNISSYDSTSGLFETGVRFVAISHEDSKIIDLAIDIHRLDLAVLDKRGPSGVGQLNVFDRLIDVDVGVETLDDVPLDSHQGLPIGVLDGRQEETR